MKSDKRIASDLTEIVRFASQSKDLTRKDRGKRPGDYTALRNSLRGIAEVPEGRLNKGKKSALTKTARRIARNYRGGQPVKVQNKAKVAALAKFTGQKKTDKVFFVSPLPGETVEVRKRGGKWAVAFTATEMKGYWRVFLPYNTKNFVADMEAEIFRVACTARGNVIAGSAGRYLLGQKRGQGGGLLSDDAVGELLRIYGGYKGELYREPDAGAEDEYAEREPEANPAPFGKVAEWAGGLFDIFDPAIDEKPGIGKRIKKRGYL